ncbi:MAG: nucleotidyltransferase family protein [Actinomycetota bacterium]
MSTAAVVLAAGGGSRFAGRTHKLLAPLAGQPVVAHVLAAVRSAALEHTIVVTGAVDLSALLGGDDLVVVHNDRWADGQSTSVAAGVRAADELGVDAVVVGLGDQPFVPAEAWRRVAGSASPLAVATYDGRRRNPVRIARALWPELPDEGDVGARDLLTLHRELVERVACPGSPDDIDTQEDLRRWS